MAQLVEKIQARVRVSRGEAEPLDGSVSLAPIARSHAGPQSLLELLNAPSRVIPIQCEADGLVLLLMRANVVWVAAPGLDPELVCPPTYRVSREERVRLVFTDRSRVEGLIPMELPEDLNRTSDFLNQASDFFPLVTANGTLLVNKLCVRETLVYEDSPPPLTPGAKPR